MLSPAMATERDAQDDRAGGDPAVARLAAEGQRERGDERADTRGGHEEPVAGGAAREVVGREGRDQHAEVHAEGGDATDDQHGQEHERRLADVAQALDEVLHDGAR